jgi:hypothetical protein
MSVLSVLEVLLEVSLNLGNVDQILLYTLCLKIEYCGLLALFIMFSYIMPHNLELTVMQGKGDMLMLFN